MWQGTVTPSRRRTPGSIPGSPTIYFQAVKSRGTNCGVVRQCLKKHEVPNNIAPYGGVNRFVKEIRKEPDTTSYLFVKTAHYRHLLDVMARLEAKAKLEPYFNSLTTKDRRVSKTNFRRQTKSYAGQFHSDVVGLSGCNILVLDGANGQQIVIDMDNSRIVVIGAVKAHHFNSYKLGLCLTTPIELFE